MSIEGRWPAGEMSPAEILELVDNTTLDEPPIQDEMLASFRYRIDGIDDALLMDLCLGRPPSRALLDLRQRLVEDVGNYKVSREMPVVNPARELSQFQRIASAARHQDLDPIEAIGFFQGIIKEAVRTQRDIAAQHERNVFEGND